MTTTTELAGPVGHPACRERSRVLVVPATELTPLTSPLGDLS
jgi:hypothetical protein